MHAIYSIHITSCWRIGPKVHTNTWLVRVQSEFLPASYLDVSVAFHDCPWRISYWFLEFLSSHQQDLCLWLAVASHCQDKFHPLDWSFKFVEAVVNQAFVTEWLALSQSLYFSFQKTKPHATMCMCVNGGVTIRSMILFEMRLTDNTFSRLHNEGGYSSYSKMWFLLEHV